MNGPYLKICFVVLILGLTSFGFSKAIAQDSWVPIKDISLMIEPDSILDFSKISANAKPIDTHIIVSKQGYLAFENMPEKPQRFLIGSLGFATVNGGFPSHALTDLYVQQYKMRGYNMVRLDFVEDTLMQGQLKDFDYNPIQLDHLHYLLAALKKNGIYYILNGSSSYNGGYGNIAQRWKGEKDLIGGIFFNPEKQQHWKKLVATMYGGVNPYTSISTLKDPAFAGMILVNEGNMVYINREGVRPETKPHFAKWLKAKYGSHKALKAAWGSEIKPDENIEFNQINFPKPDAWTSRRMSDLQAFFVDTEKSTADWMTNHLRQLGFKGQVTSYNFWLAPAAQVSRGQFNWVDMHNYFAHPEYLDSNKIRVRQDSMVKNSAGYIQELAANKHIGKAFTVTEFGQVFWNQYRRESGLAIPAYAALQSWDGICQHFGAVDLSYAGTNGRKSTIYPFAVGLDPIARATETLAALLYLRGDVSPAVSTISVKLTPQDAFDNSAHLGYTPTDITKLSLIMGLGIDWQPEPTVKTKVTYTAEVDFNKTGIRINKNNTNKTILPTQSLGLKLDSFFKRYASGLAYKASKVKLIADDKWVARVQNLRDAKLISTNNLTNPETGIYQSDTGEILLDSQHKRMDVITPNTEAVVFDEFKPINLNQLSVLSADGPALVAVSAMDNQPVNKSKRLLVVLATDARNTDMRFSDTTETVVLDLGKKPVIIKTAKVKLALKNVNKGQLKVFSINLRGQRQDAIMVTQTETSIEFELDISKLSHGATTYFEISV